MAQEMNRRTTLGRSTRLTSHSALLKGALILGLGLWSATPTLASKVRAFRAAEASHFLAGEFDGVSVGPLGKLRLASALERVTGVEEPFLLSATGDGSGGWVLGTGNSGKVLHVSAEGELRELFATEEPEVFAVWVDGDAVYAAGSPDARVYRASLDEPAAGATMIFDTGERYAWALGRESGARGSSRLLIATGINGQLIAVEESTGTSEVVYDSEDVHLRTLLVRDDDVLVGTVGEGRILSLQNQGASPWSARTLHDAEQPEITSLTAGPNGSIFAAAVASEASLAQLTPPAAGQDASGAAAPAAGTRPTGFEGARSVVLEIDQDGTVEERGSFKKETVYSVLWTQTGATTGQLWIATGQEGKLYRSRGSEVVLERDLDELQLMQLMNGAPGEAGSRLSVATTNGAAVYRTTAQEVSEGVYFSKVLDAKFPARFGTLHYEAALPKGAAVTFAVRSGLSAFPDDTWSEWVDVSSGSASDQRGGLSDLDLKTVPRGRYVQWKATLKRGNGRNTDGAGPELSVVELTYAQENRRPEITKLEVLSPGVILVNSSFNPSNQVFEPNSTNREGIFNSLDKPAVDKKARSKELWKLGYRTIRWEAKDPNADELRYKVALREEASNRWYTIADEVKQKTWGFDSTVLPDGLYRVRLSAHDGVSNIKGQERDAERVSGLVVVDHTAPMLEEQTMITDHRAADPTQGRAGVEWRLFSLVIEDQLSPLRKIEVSHDAGPWQELIPDDGMLDSRRESVVVETQVADAPSLVLLRVTDTAFNSTVIQLQAP